MVPILATAAVSAAGEIFHYLAAKAANTPASSAPAPIGAAKFSTLLDRSAGLAANRAISSPPPALSAAQARQHLDDLTGRLFKSTEVAGAINQSGASGPWQIQLEANGSAALRAGDGSSTPIRFSEEMKSVARELYQARNVSQAGAGAQKPQMVLLTEA